MDPQATNGQSSDAGDENLAHQYTSAESKSDGVAESEVLGDGEIVVRQEGNLPILLGSNSLGFYQRDWHRWEYVVSD